MELVPMSTTRRLGIPVPLVGLGQNRNSESPKSVNSTDIDKMKLVRKVDGVDYRSLNWSTRFFKQYPIPQTVSIERVRP